MQTKLEAYMPEKLLDDLYLIATRKYGVTMTSFLKPKLRQLVDEELSNWKRSTQEIAEHNEVIDQRKQKRHNRKNN